MDGVIYYNAGRGCLVRMAVSLLSLRKVYNGHVTIIAENDNGLDGSVRIAHEFGAELKSVTMPDTGKNKTMLNRTLLHTVTPYDVTLNIDADTVVLMDPSRMFGWAKEFEFVVCNFCDWTTKSRKIQKRVREILKDEQSPSWHAAMDFGYALNCGVYAWANDCEWMRCWYDLAKEHRNVFICDEKTCQAHLWRYRYFVTDQRFNCSSVHGEVADNTRIVHFHGRKHCRIKDGQYQYNSDLWYRCFDEAMGIAPWLRDYIQDDRQLRKNLPRYEALKGKS